MLVCGNNPLEENRSIIESYMVKYILRYTRTFGTGSASGRGGSSSTTGLLIVQHRRDLQNREKELT